MEQMQTEHAAAAMLNGERTLLRLVRLDAHWFAPFEFQYGFSFKQANRRYEVSREVRHVRMVIFWCSLFRVRKYFLLEKGCDPVLWNFDETPFYENEVGAQDKPTLVMQGDLAPVVENKGKAHSRWTANLSCCSSPERILERWPWAEAMYKAVDDGPKYRELQDIHRTSGLSRCVSV